MLRLIHATSKSITVWWDPRLRGRKWCRLEHSGAKIVDGCEALDPTQPDVDGEGD